MKTFCKFFVYLIVLSCTLNTAVAQDEIVDIPDPVLAAVIRDKLNLAPNVPITKQQMRRLSFLWVYDSDIIRITGERNWIRDLTGLEHAAELTSLVIYFGRINDLSPLTGLTQLTHLYLTGNDISDLRPLAGLTQLRVLEIYYNPVSDFSPLTGLTQLTELEVSVTSVELMNDLRHNVDLTQLKRLGIVGEGNQIGDINFFENLTQLEYLSLYDAQISDVSPLAGLTNLRSLSLGSNQISDITPLAGLTNLQYLSLGSNQISDITPLAGLTNLESMFLDNNQISDVSPLTGLINLQGLLILRSNQIVDVTPLAGLINLLSLALNDNQIVDVTPLAGLTNLGSLDLRDNQIIDITPLAPLTNRLTNPTTLYIEGNPIVEYTDFLVVESVQAHHIKSDKEIGSSGPGTGAVIHDRYPGQDFEIHATVKNRGFKDSTSAVLKYYLSDDKDISTDTKDDELLDASLIKPLPATNSVKVSVRVTAPKAPGVYYYGACLADSVGEGNCFVVKITVRELKPDLTVNFIGEDHYEVDIYKRRLNLLVEVKNEGSEVSEKTNLQLGYSPSVNENESEDNIPVPMQYPKYESLQTYKLVIPSLKPGETVKRSVWITAPHKVGVYYYSAHVDRVSNESDAKNNRSKSIRITYATDLWPGFISQVAHSVDGYTYFVVDPPTYLNVPDRSLLEFEVKECSVTLHTPNSGYFMFPLEEPKGHKVEEIVEATEENLKLGLKIAGFIPDSWWDEAGGFLKSIKNGLKKLSNVLNALEIFGYIANIIRSDDPTTHPKLTVEPPNNFLEIVRRSIGEEVFGVKYNSFLPPILFLIREDLSSIDITVYQKYRVENEDFDRELTYVRTWNLKDSARTAPSARPMTLIDYSPFQQLQPEIQEYLLQHFGATANAKLTNVEQLQIPEETSLLPNYPNPFNPETWIPYQLAKSADVTLTIYDLHGHVVRDLDLGHQPVGIYQSRNRAAYWDGKNDIGEAVASGVYFYTLTAEDFSATRKMLILK